MIEFREHLFGPRIPLAVVGDHRRLGLRDAAHQPRRQQHSGPHSTSDLHFAVPLPHPRVTRPGGNSPCGQPPPGSPAAATRPGSARRSFHFSLSDAGAGGEKPERIRGIRPTTLSVLTIDRTAETVGVGASLTPGPPSQTRVRWKGGPNPGPAAVQRAIPTSRSPMGSHRPETAESCPNPWL